jgi:mRNA interferase RelE/StbE
LGYSVEYRETVRKQLRKLDRSIAKRIVDYLDEAGALDDPRSRGKGLIGDRTGIWRYRVGDYRVLCELRDSELVILALEVGHRRSVYGTRRN